MVALYVVLVLVIGVAWPSLYLFAPQKGVSPSVELESLIADLEALRSDVDEIRAEVSSLTLSGNFK